MTREERVLYHQIHPFKLAVDWGSGLVALLLFWYGQGVLGLIVGFVPPPLASWAVINRRDVEALRDTAFGRYAWRFMRRRAISLGRMFGYLVALIGAFYHLPFLIPAGLLAILASWTYGLVVPTLAQE